MMMGCMSPPSGMRRPKLSKQPILAIRFALKHDYARQKGGVKRTVPGLSVIVAGSWAVL